MHRLCLMNARFAVVVDGYSVGYIDGGMREWTAFLGMDINKRPLHTDHQLFRSKKAAAEAVADAAREDRKTEEAT